MNHYESRYDSPKSKISDASNQFIQFNLFETMEQVSSARKKVELKTLEEYTGETKETLDSAIPNVTERYNALIEEFQSPDLTYERFREILEEAFAITHPK